LAGEKQTLGEKGKTTWFPLLPFLRRKKK